MQRYKYWILFILCALGWLASTLVLAPEMNFIDAFIFRDAGWNLAQWGHFESAALLYMTDLTPRLFAHYTPAMPLLFYGFLKVFPHNAYAGTVFNLLLGLAAAAVALFWVLRQPPSPVRNLAALLIAVLPILFITVDRPEALGLILFCLTIASCSAEKLRPVAIGFFIALTFLAHPFVAILAAFWAFILILAHNLQRPRPWMNTARQLLLAGVAAVLPVAIWALILFTLDHESMRRFLAHSFGIQSGMASVHGYRANGGLIQTLASAAHCGSALNIPRYTVPIAGMFALIAGALRDRRRMTAFHWLLVLALAVSVLLPLLLFSIQSRYIWFLAFALPLGLLIASRQDERFKQPALLLLVLGLLATLPVTAIGILQRLEMRDSFQSAQAQPAFLLAHLPSPESVVAMQGSDYDIFKPQIHRLIKLDQAQSIADFSKLDGVANCYDGFQGEEGDLLPFPSLLDAANFHLIQPAPGHQWITVGGRRIMSRQWGYGCDLYVRNGSPAIAFNAGTKPGTAEK